VLGALVEVACSSESSNPAAAGGAPGSGGFAGASAASGGIASGGNASGGNASGGTTTGGITTGGMTTGGTTTGGTASGGNASGGATTGGNASGGTDAGIGGEGGGGRAATGGAPSPDDDPAEGSYGTRKALPAANSEMAVAELDGKIYLLGGYPSSPAESQSVVAVYEIASDSWGFAAELPVALHHPVAVGLAGKVYSLGGQLRSGETARTLAYDPVLDQWTDLSPMPTARGGGAAAIIDDRIYVAGGRSPAANAFEVYDVGDDEWTVLPDLPESFPGRNHLAATAIGGKVYVAGGRYDGDGFSSPMTRSLDIYDPVSNGWTKGADLPRERGGVNGIAANGCFFVWGGEGGDIGEPNNVFPDHDVYDPATDTWTELADLPTPIHGVTGAAFVGGIIYMPGGGTRQGGSSGTTLFQVYRPAKTCP
jgi:N-acetylneuraminic acid mutarotase